MELMMTAPQNMGSLLAGRSRREHVLAYCLEPGYGIVRKEDAEEGDYASPIFWSKDPDQVAAVWDSMND